MKVSTFLQHICSFFSDTVAFLRNRDTPRFTCTLGHLGYVHSNRKTQAYVTCHSKIYLHRNDGSEPGVLDMVYIWYHNAWCLQDISSFGSKALKSDR